jgi:mono/diheme cytochrome c family protein
MPANSRHLPQPLRSGVVLILALVLLLILSAAAAAQEGDVTRGSQIYDANCAVCHGSEGQGRVGVNLSQDFPAIDPNAFLRSVIADGVSGTTMPPWSQEKGGPLTEQEIDDVVAFVDSLSGGRSAMAPTATPLPVTPVPTVPGATGDPGTGRVLFVENCAMCHGDEAQGRVGSSLNKAFASFDPQQFVRATVAQGISGTAMPAWSVNSGGPLSEEEIDHISAYIVSLAPSEPADSGETPPPEPEPASGAASALMVVLALVLVAVVIVLVMYFSSRGQTSQS